MRVEARQAFAASALGFALFAALNVWGWDVGWLAAAVAFVALATALQQSTALRAARPHALDFLTAAFVAWALAVTLARDLPWQSDYQVLAFLLFPLGYLSARLDAEFAWDAVCGVLFVLAGAVALVSIALAVAGEPVNVYFAIRNNQAAFIGVALFLAVRRPPRLPSPAWAALVVVLAAGVSVTGSRGAFTAAGCAALASVLVLHPSRWRMLLPFAAAGVAGFALGTLATTGWAAERVAMIASGSDARWRIWLSALPLITDHPVIGYGLGMTEPAWAPFRWSNEGSVGRHLHSDYLQFALETGLAGGVMLALLPVTAFAHALRRRSDDLRSAAGIAAIAALSVHTLVDYHLQIPALLLTYGLVLGLFASTCSDVVEREPRRARLVAAAVAAALFALNAARLVAYDASSPLDDSHAERVRRGHVPYSPHYAGPVAAEARERELAALRRAARWQPGYEGIWVRAGALELEAGRYDRAVRALERALACNAFSAEARYQLARVALARGDAAAAEAALREAVALRPRLFAAHELLFNLLLAEGRADDAYAQMSTAFAHARTYDPRQHAFLAAAADRAHATGDRGVVDGLERFARASQRAEDPARSRSQR